MNSKRQKICLLFCGGSGLNSDSSVISVSQEKDINRWIASIPELRILADIEPVFVTDKNGTKMNGSDWEKISREIARRLDEFDGFVVTHDIEGIEYTAAALTFAFANLPKPIIMTGSYRLPARMLDLREVQGISFRANLINAIQIAKLDIAEVGLVFGNRIIKGIKAVKSHDASLNVFYPADGKYLGRIDFKIILEKVQTRRNESPKIQAKFENCVELFKLYSQLPPGLLDLVLNEKLRGAVLELSDDLTFSEMDQNFIKAISRQKKPVLLYSKDNNPKTSKEIMQISNMTLPATLIKLKWLLTQEATKEKIYQRMGENIAGEIIT